MTELSKILINAFFALESNNLAEYVRLREMAVKILTEENVFTEELTEEVKPDYLH